MNAIQLNRDFQVHCVFPWLSLVTIVASPAMTDNVGTCICDTLKFSITTPPAADLAVSFSTTPMGDIVSNSYVFQLLLLVSTRTSTDSHIFQKVDMTVCPNVKDTKATGGACTTHKFSFTTQPTAELAVSFSTTPTGDTVSIIFSKSLC